MDYGDRFKNYEATYKQAVDNIKQYLTDGDDDVRLLVSWLMVTNANPYGFLPIEWTGVMDDAVGFSSLCHQINHALVDDGTIDFISIRATVNIHDDASKFYSYHLEPRISFMDRWTEGYEDKILSQTELGNKTSSGNRTVSYSITYIKNVEEFITLHDKYEIDQLKRRFIADAQKNFEDALYHYQSNALFRNEWISELK